MPTTRPVALFAEPKRKNTDADTAFVDTDFCGICELDWSLSDKTLFCLIGRGDSTKSTILEALRFLSAVEPRI